MSHIKACLGLFRCFNPITIMVYAYFEYFLNKKARYFLHHLRRCTKVSEINLILLVIECTGDFRNLTGPKVLKKTSQRSKRAS